MRLGERRRRGDRGFTYLGVLVLVAALSLLLAGAGQLASTVARREREAQLLWVGHEYRAAIGRYWALRRSFPRALEDLLGGSREGLAPVRCLRRLYPDPMTGAADWTLLPAPGGGIMGVASSSRREPLKTGGFDEADQAFEKATSYGDWQFTFAPAIRPGAVAPGAVPPGPAGPARTPGRPVPPAGRPRG